MTEHQHWAVGVRNDTWLRQPTTIPDFPDYGSFIRTHQGNLSGTHFGCFGVSRAI